MNGVDYFFQRLKARDRNASDIDELKVCAIGEATAERLHDLHVHVDVVPDEFKAEGVFEARVDVVPAYRTSLPANLDRGRVAAMLSGSADCIAFTSSSTVKNLAQLFDTQDLGKALAGVVIACIGDITATTAADYGLRVEIQPDEFTIPALARSIADHYSR